jgi:hypothetical protein
MQPPGKNIPARLEQQGDNMEVITKKSHLPVAGVKTSASSTVLNQKALQAITLARGVVNKIA